jgi:putative nucleotidyltransferase with HDIG domain
MAPIAIINPDAPGEIRKNLARLGLDALEVPRCGLADKRIAGHPDIQLFVLGTRLICRPDIGPAFLRKMEKHAEIVTGRTRPADPYPGDVPYNAAYTGRFAFHSLRHTDPVLRESLREAGAHVIDVAQGYAGCSTLVIGREEIITADPSIHAAASSHGLRSLLISPGHVGLPGHPYGFIGGASGTWGGTLLLTGRIDHHPDGKKIVERIGESGKKVVYLSEERATDLGTIFIMGTGDKDMERGEKIPTIEECCGLMKRFEMLPNIVAHSEQVTRVARAILDHLKEGSGINRDAVIAACLLHDITKTRSFQTKEPHDVSGGQLLAELGFPSLGKMVEEHVILKDFQPGGKLQEKEIVNYADKRVMHDRIVTLEERVTDLLDRYGTTDEMIELINRNKKLVFDLEAKIGRHMTGDIGDIIGGIGQPS